MGKKGEPQSRTPQVLVPEGEHIQVLVNGKVTFDVANTDGVLIAHEIGVGLYEGGYTKASSLTTPQGTRILPAP